MIGNMTSQQQLYTKAEYLSALNAAMKEIDPDASVVEGDVLSCIFSAVAEVLSASSLNQIDPDTFFNLDSKNGQGLDDFAALLGMTRLAGTYAHCDLQFYLPSPASSDLSIPVGCQVEDGNGHVFATTSEAILKTGQSSITTPANATEVGTGSNVQPYVLTSFASAISSSLCVQNPAAAVGGTNAETDAEFRARIKADLFYRQIGTAASFDEAVRKIDDNGRVRTVGAEQWHTQYAPLATLPDNYGGGLGVVSNVLDAKYVYPASSFLIKNEGQSDQTDYQEGVAYQFDLSTDPAVPAFVVTATGSLDLSSYSGQALNALGAKIGLPRYAGTVGTGLIVFSLLSSVNATVIVPAFTRFRDSAGNAYQTLKNAYIQPLSPSSQPVPFSSISVGGAGSLQSGTSVNVDVATSTPGNLYGTVTTYAQGTPAWTDGQYITQLEEFLASQSGLAEGEMVYTAFQYCPSCSRCDIPNGITDKVDIFIDGQLGEGVIETGLISLLELTGENNQNWIYAEGNYVPQGSFIQLLATPAIDALQTGTIQAGGATYQVRLAKTLGGNHNSTRSQSALVFDASGTPEAGSTYIAPLIQNKALIDSQYEASTASPLSLDVLVHEGLQAQISLSLLVQPLPGATSDQIQTSLSSILSSYFSSLPFGGFVNTTEILAEAMTSPYVQTCRFANINPIQVAIPYSADAQITSYTDSFYLPTNAYPVLANLSAAYGSDQNAGTLPSPGTGFSTGLMPNIFTAYSPQTQGWGASN